jgi:hypothetical protein
MMLLHCFEKSPLTFEEAVVVVPHSRRVEALMLKASMRH